MRSLQPFMPETAGARFNSIMRLVSGIFFGAGLAWWALPYLDEYFQDIAESIRYKFQRKNIAL